MKSSWAFCWLHVEATAKSPPSSPCTTATSFLTKSHRISCIRYKYRFTLRSRYISLPRLRYFNYHRPGSRIPAGSSGNGDLNLVPLQHRRLPVDPHFLRRTCYLSCSRAVPIRYGCSFRNVDCQRSPVTGFAGCLRRRARRCGDLRRRRRGTLQRTPLNSNILSHQVIVKWPLFIFTSEPDIITLFDPCCRVSWLSATPIRDCN